MKYIIKIIKNENITREREDDKNICYISIDKRVNDSFGKVNYISDRGSHIKSIIERDKEIYDERNDENKSKDYQNIIERDEKH